MVTPPRTTPRSGPVNFLPPVLTRKSTRIAAQASRAEASPPPKTVEQLLSRGSADARLAAFRRQASSPPATLQPVRKSTRQPISTSTSLEKQGFVVPGSKTAQRARSQTVDTTGPGPTPPPLTRPHASQIGNWDTTRPDEATSRQGSEVTETSETAEVAARRPQIEHEASLGPAENPEAERSRIAAATEALEREVTAMLQTGEAAQEANRARQWDADEAGMRARCEQALEAAQVTDTSEPTEDADTEPPRAGPRGALTEEETRTETARYLAAAARRREIFDREERIQEETMVRARALRQAALDEEGEDRLGDDDDTPPTSTPTATPTRRRNNKGNYKRPGKSKQTPSSRLAPQTTPSTIHPSDDALLAEFLTLDSLPTLLVPLPPYLHAEFTNACRRCVAAYKADPCSKTLFDILALPKYAIVATELTGPRATDRLRAYPGGEPPPVAMKRGTRRQQGEGDVNAAVEKLVSKGRIAAGSRKLGGESKVAQCTDETVEKLRSLQPSGAPNPFGEGAGPPNGAVPKEDDMLDALSSLPADVASGVDGWGVSLLRLACKDDEFRSFITTLTATIAAGTAPGAGLLCVSRITPLIKDDAGGIRPIAVGSLIYRLAMKAIVRKMCSPSMLGKNQLGVKTKGGVEPAIRLITRAMRGELPEVYKWLVSLDAKNAFNLKSRKSIADAVRKHAPALYRVAKWAYNQRSILVVSGLETRLDDEEGWLDVIYSSEGVRQGDPLGPLLFSIAMRVVIEDLQNHLGPGRLIIAYLDDLYILSSTHNPLPEAIEFFRTHPHHLTLNEQKSHFWSMDDVRTKGVAILGSFIGPKEGRENFLRGKVTQLSAKLDKLSGLRSQHALLILRTSYQQQLRHLQRCLDTSDLGHVWAELDAKLWATVKSFRGSVLSHQFEDEIISLPLRLGGMGILSHQEVAPIASKAADEMSDEVLAEMLDDEDEGGEVQVIPVSQGKRCREMFDKRCETLLAKLGDKERKAMVENGSMLGRKWLSAIPWSKAQNLTNHEISAALHSRTLIPFNSHCVNCGHTPDLGHGETCNISGKYPRHNAVVRAIGAALKSVRGTRVVYEPTASDESLRRNDLQVWGSADLGLGISEHDIKVYSLFGTQAHSSFGSELPTTSTSPPTTQQPIWDQIAAQADRYLRGVAAKARENAPPGVGKFTAIVMSTGGLVEKDTKAQMDVWQKSVGEWHWAMMTRRLSIGLVRARARVMTWI